MEEVKRDIFYSLVNDFRWIPFTQTDAYCQSIVPDSTLHYFIDDSKNPQIGCVAFLKKKAGLTMLCIQGECLKSETAVSRKQRTAFYSDILRNDYDIYDINLNTIYTEDEEIAMRRTGLLRPTGLFSTTLSKLISLSSPREYDKSWRRNLRLAHNEGLTFSITDSPTQAQIANYAAKHAELLRRKHFSGSLTAAGLTTLFSDNRFRLAIVCAPDGTDLAEGIIYSSPENSNFLYSYTTVRGRELSASYMLYEGIFNALAAEGIEYFDMGRISPAAHEKDKLFLFKDGVKGRYVKYLGEWEWCRHRWQSEMLYFMKKYVWHRQQA